MRVKDTVLTFVAMGGFAVPVAFQAPASATTDAPVAQVVAAPAPAEDPKSQAKA